MPPPPPAAVWTRLQQLAAAADLAPLLADGELPALLLQALEHLCERPQPARVQQVVALLLQVIELPARGGGDPALLAHARDWALDTLLDMSQALERGGSDVALGSCTASPALQQLQTALCTASTPAPALGELQEAVFSAFALQQAPLAPAAFTRALELCATHVTDGLECALFLDAMLASRTAIVAMPPALPKRLLAVDSSSNRANDEDEAPGRLFDQLSVVAMVRVWGNHLPSWEAQLQEWLLQVHAAPFAAVSAIVWRASEGEEPADARAAFRDHSYLYVTLLEWFARHRSCLASPRSRELLGCLARVTRLGCDHRAFGRRLVHALGFADDEREKPTVMTPRKRKRAFSRTTPALAELIEQMQQEAVASDMHGDTSSTAASVDNRLLYEWMGLAEHPQILHEALELLVTASDERSEGEKLNGANSGSELEAQRLGAASLIGWFYAFTSTNTSAASITALTHEITSSLARSNLFEGSAWLQRNRSTFRAQPQLCIRIAWFWLLRMSCASVDSIQSDAAVVDALESLEYAFRRFAPTKPAQKRSFQVDVVAQLLADLEWRWEVVVQADRKSPHDLRESLDVSIAWLKKIVHLMQVEQPPHRVAAVLAKVAAASNSSTARLLEQLATRLEQLTHAPVISTMK